MEDRGKGVAEDGESQGSSDSIPILGGFPYSHNKNYNQVPELGPEATMIPFVQTMNMDAPVPIEPFCLGVLSEGARSSRTQTQEIVRNIANPDTGKEIESANVELDLCLLLNTQMRNAQEQGARVDDNCPVILSSGYSSFVLEDNGPGEGSSTGLKKVTCKRKLNGGGSKWSGLGLNTSPALQAALDQQPDNVRATNQFPSGNPQEERNVRRRIELNQEILNRVAPSAYMHYQQFNHVPGSLPFGTRHNFPANPIQFSQGSSVFPTYIPGFVPSSGFPAGYLSMGYFPGDLATSSRAASPIRQNYLTGNSLASITCLPKQPRSLQSRWYQRHFGGETSDRAEIVNRIPQREMNSLTQILGYENNCIFVVSREMGESARGGNVRTPHATVPRRNGGFTNREARQAVGGGRGGGNLHAASNPSAANQCPINLVSEESTNSVEEIQDARFGLREEIIRERLRRETYVPNEIDRCAICLEEFVAGDHLGKLQYCGHFFHFECIKRWLRLKNMCPVCESWAVDIN